MARVLGGAGRALLGAALAGATLRAMWLPFTLGSVASVGCGSAAIDAGIASCGQIDAASCASNDDCNAAPGLHCTSVGVDSGVAVTCCQTGPRGTLEAGAPCTSLDDCPTAICAYTCNGEMELCSGPCKTDADCAVSPGLPSCVSYPGGDAGTMFCGLPQDLNCTPP